MKTSKQKSVGDNGRAVSKRGKAGQGEIHLQRVYDLAPADGSACFLVDRLWPRGLKKSSLANTEWLPDIAPSAELRKWFGHEPAKWAEFCRRYRSELKKNPGPAKRLIDATKKGDVTLLFGAKDIHHNQAVVLKEFLEERGA